MVSVATYITWESFNSAASTIEELRDKLASIPRLQIVYACSAIDAFLEVWRGHPDIDQHESLLKTFFSPKYAGLLNETARRTNSPQFVFHRQQLLFLIREAINFSPDLPDIGQEFKTSFAELCLRANDLMHHGLAVNAQMSQVKRLLPEFVTINDFTTDSDILRRAARTRICLEDILNRPNIRKRPEFIDIPQLFTSATGFTIREYSNLVLAILTKYLAIKPGDYSQAGIMKFTRQFFQSTNVKPDTLDRFLRDISGTFDEIRKESIKPTHLNDFAALRSKPVLKVEEDSYFALDASLVADKLEAGVFWRVHASCCSDKERDNLHTLWGHVFQQYVNLLFEGSQVRGQFVSIPNFEGGAEVMLTPLFILTVGELEQIMPYLNSVRLCDLLEAKYSTDSSQTWPFSAVSNPLLDGLPKKTNIMLDRKANDIYDQLCRDLFNIPFESLKNPKLEH